MKGTLRRSCNIWHGRFFIGRFLVLRVLGDLEKFVLTKSVYTRRLYIKVYVCKHKKLRGKLEMLMKDTKISDAELEILETLWAAGEALNANEIRARLNEKKDWERTTVLTLIRRLLDKGVIAQEKQGVYYYSPLVAREDYVKGETKSFLNKFFKGNAKNLAAALIEDENLSREDVEELRNYFRDNFR